MTNLVKGLHDQIVRCRDLVKIYETIPSAGFALMMIRPAIERAERVLEGGDLTKMARCYKELERFE